MKVTLKVWVLALSMGAIIQTIYAGSNAGNEKITANDLIQLIEAHENDPSDIEASQKLDKALNRYKSDRSKKRSTIFSILLNSHEGPGV